MSNGESKSLPRWAENAFWALFGAAVSSLMGPYGTVAIDKFNELKSSLCGANQYLNLGRDLRREAIELALGRNESLSMSVDSMREIATKKHHDANAAFEAADRCGSALARAHLGQAYCFGWDVKKDRPKGMSMIRTAWKEDQTLAEWVMDPKICPDVKP